MSLAQLLYVSRATIPMNAVELHKIINSSKYNNSRRDVTGMLLYSNGWFMQLLEGEPKQLNELYNIISRDRRHNQIKQLMLELVNERAFQNWSMGLINLDESSDMDISRFEKLLAEFNSGQFTDSERHLKAVTLLAQFVAERNIDGKIPAMAPAWF